MTEVEVNGTVADLDIQATKAALESSSTSRRTQCLQTIQERLARAEIEPRLLPPLLRLYFNTYAFYHDKKSRAAVERSIRTIFSSDADPEALAGFVKSLKAETLKPGLAPSNTLILVRWCSILLQELSRISLWDKWGLDILICNCQALQSCLNISARPYVKNAALQATKHGLEKVFQARQGAIAEIIQRLSTKGNGSTADNAVMLGALAGVCAKSPELHGILSDKKSDLYAFYNREIIGSRTPVAPHVANALKDFFAGFSTDEDIANEVAPAVEKALLRAPEIVLDDLLTPLFHALPDSVDISAILQTKLLKPLISNTKSTSAAIRNGALSAFKAAVLKCHDIVVISKITDEILTPLTSGKLSSADQRAYHAEMLAVLPIPRPTAAASANAIAVVAGKEANEAALLAETLALLHYIEWGLANGVDIEKPVIDAMVKGMGDKKVPVKRLWTARFGDLLWNTKDQSVLTNKFPYLTEAVLPALLETWKEVSLSQKRTQTESP